MRIPIFTGIFICLVLMSCMKDEAESTMDPVKTEDAEEFVRQRIEHESVKDSTIAARFSFETLVFDFDTISEGTVITHSFEFVNTGKSTLEIYDARSTCGCTVPSYPEEAISPGGAGQIDIKFNSEDKSGVQDKPIVIIANTYPRRTELRIRGFVKQSN